MGTFGEMGCGSPFPCRQRGGCSRRRPERKPQSRGYWNLPDDQLDPDPVKAAVDGLLLPCNVLDFLQHFTVFETKKGKTVKKVARYQQFEAANDLVDRVLERIGKPALLYLGMRLGEASGATLALGILKAAVACHAGMATFAEAGVSGPS